MKMTLRFCSTLAVALSVAVAAHAQQNPAGTPVPEPAAPAAPAPAPAAAPVAAPAVDATPTTNSVPKAKAATKMKTTTAKKPVVKKKTVAKPAAAAKPATSGTETNKSVTRIEVNPPEAGTVKQDAVNVRGRPSFIGEVITKLKKGESVSVLEEISLAKAKKGEPDKWLKIGLPTNTPVWVFAEYIDSSKTVVPKKLNVRAGPGENFSPIGIMQKGETVKELRRVNDWIEIEPPASAFAYVAAEFIDRKGAAPEVAVTPAPPVAPEAPKPIETTVPTPEPAVKAAVDAPAEPAKPAEPAPAPAPAPAPEPVKEEPKEVVVKRIVKREGTLKRAINIQSPTDYRLEGLDGKENINWVTSPEEQKMDEKTKKMITVPKIDLKPYIGKRVIITGVEALDSRWALTPILTVESIDLEQ
jgi:hypothetical protein